MRLGIYAGALGAAVATWGSLESGVALEMTAVRAVVVFLALATAGYFADLVVVTAPPTPVEEPQRAELDDEADDETAGDEMDEHDEDRPATTAAARDERRAIAPGRQAA